MSRVLIGGVGYRNLRDHSFGVVLVDSLTTQEWPPNVSVEDISYNPIAVVQRLQDDSADRRFRLAVVIGAMQRPGRTPGTLSVYRWDNVLPSDEGIHEAITEAVTGIIALDNTLVVARHFGALPPTVVVIELEPDAHEFGDSLTPAVDAALSRARDIVTSLAVEPETAERIPQGALAAERPRHTGVVFGQVIDGPHESTKAGGARDVLAEVDRAMSELQAHPDAAVREAVTTMLEGIDAVHRAGLTHLVQALHGMSGDTLINRLIADPAIRMLLMSYDLIAVDRRLQAEEALDTVRGHLHEHGVDVEIQEVVGGVVYVRLHLTRRDGQDVLPIDRIRTDLEAALREFFIGFQELEFRVRDLHAPPSAIVPLDALRRANRPVYHDALNADEVPEGTLRAAMVNDISVLFGRVNGEVYAIRNQCGDSPFPLELGTLEGAEVRCPWHGCRYDIRSGRRLDDEGRVQVLPVTTEAGRIHVAIDVETGAR